MKTFIKPAFLLAVLFAFSSAYLYAQPPEKLYGQTYGERYTEKIENDNRKPNATTTGATTQIQYNNIDMDAVIKANSSKLVGQAPKTPEQIAFEAKQEKAKQAIQDADRNKFNTLVNNKPVDNKPMFSTSIFTNINLNQTGTCLEGDCLNGKGKLKFSDGTIYEGYFEKGDQSRCTEKGNPRDS